MNRLFLVLIISLCSIQLFSQAKVQVATGTAVISTNGAQIVVEDMDVENDGVIHDGDGRLLFTGMQQNYLGGKGGTILNGLSIAKAASVTLQLKQNISLTGEL